MGVHNDERVHGPCWCVARVGVYQAPVFTGLVGRTRPMNTGIILDTRESAGAIVRSFVRSFRAGAQPTLDSSA